MMRVFQSGFWIDVLHGCHWVQALPYLSGTLGMQGLCHPAVFDTQVENKSYVSREHLLRPLGSAQSMLVERCAPRFGGGDKVGDQGP
ncbi:hypothetical protein F4775DRAFT_28141 [Biscogniauxia sp. FL1348]|nr:hypothetical protein F4775DRAFT_28141 [Biscogniauxia sp. FL1348]